MVGIAGKAVRTEDFSKEILVCSNNVVIKEHEVLQGNVIVTPNGQTVVDFGQNIAGYSGFSCRAKNGQFIKRLRMSAKTEKIAISRSLLFLDSSTF